MASMAYHKDVKRWRVFWHVTLPDGTVDMGSRLRQKERGSRITVKRKRNYSKEPDWWIKLMP